MKSPRSDRSVWETGIDHEVQYWRDYLATEGFHGAEDFLFRFDRDAPLQPHLADRLPQGLPACELRILDCAAGPATVVGKTLGGNRLPITAVDALAEQYRSVLQDLHLTPPVPSIPCDVEQLDTKFGSDQFSLVYMRFALDHCYDPIGALRQMVRVVRPGCVVMVEHYRDEHETEYQGLKNWTLMPEPNDLVICNTLHRLSVQEELPGIPIEIDSSPSWLTLILHKPSG